MNLFLYKVFRKLRKIRLKVLNSFINLCRTPSAKISLSRFKPPYKLNIGCGPVKFKDWVNVDIVQKWGKVRVDLVWDATQPFPLPDSSCSLIYNEHFIEHLSVPQGLAFLTECKRILMPGGILRIATPSLEDTVHQYLNDWRNPNWVRLPGLEHVKTPAEMLNMAFREWGHQWIYDDEELHRRLIESGFTILNNKEWGLSENPELCNRETRKESVLIIEAVKSSDK